MLNESKIIFIDADKYSNKELIGYCKLKNKLVANNELPENYTLIKEIARTLATGYDIVFLTYTRALRLIGLNRKKNL